MSRDYDYLMFTMMRQFGPSAVAVMVLIFLVPQEIQVSQVFYEEIPHDWEFSLQYAPVIVLARRIGDPVVYREWIFPKETHFQQEAESRAAEWAQGYAVVEVLRPGTGHPLEPGQKILVWEAPEYHHSEIEHYHETGDIYSPFILKKTPTEEPGGVEVILFLQPHEEIWTFFNDAPEEGKALLERIPASKLQAPAH
jgi:hypothetical protein